MSSSPAPSAPPSLSPDSSPTRSAPSVGLTARGGRDRIGNGADATPLYSSPLAARLLGTTPRHAAHSLAGTRVLARPGSRHFSDQHGRALVLRGVNVAGHSKLPTRPNGSSHLAEGFFDHRAVSFVGRPFREDEIDEHFMRLRAWGLTFVRLIVTWESIEHEGPGIYDEEYISYLIKVLKRAARFGIKCFVAVGLDIKTFDAVNAAHVHNTVEDKKTPHMFWPTNYAKLACSTMFTLFFGGDVFAPNFLIEGESASSYLQRHFINAYVHLAERLKDCSSVIGFELMNEPHYGYIGLRDLNKFPPYAYLHFGTFPSALQSFALGDGMEVDIDFYVKSWPLPKKIGTKLLNTNHTKAWLNGQDCICSALTACYTPYSSLLAMRDGFLRSLPPRKRHGVWDVDPSTGSPRVLKPDYFYRDAATGRPYDFSADFYAPFMRRYARAIHARRGDLLVFFEPIPNEDPPVLSKEDRDEPNVVYAPHWYDLYSLNAK
ncbi:hypothetical protein HK405_013191, partial [Cladochytrium tenue]